MQPAHGKKILILGASGFIGRALSERLGNEQCMCTYNSGKKLVNGIHFNILADSIANIDTSAVSHAVVLFGVTNPDQCANSRELSDAVNIRGIKRVVDELGERQIPCIFASSEVVFDGLKGDYVESDPPHPILRYGIQKRIVEEYIAEKWPLATSIRIAKVYGTRPGDKSLLDGWFQQALLGGEIRCAADFISSAVHIDDVVTSILAICSNGLYGTYHVGGPRGISRYDLFLSLLDAIQKKHRIPSTRVVPCSIDDFVTVEKRPKNVSFVTKKLVRDTGIVLRPFEDGCKEYVGRT